MFGQPPGHHRQRVGFLQDDARQVTVGQPRLLAIAGREQERDAQLVKPVGDREAVRVAKVDVEDGDVGLMLSIATIAPAPSPSVVTSPRAEPTQHVLGVEGDDQAVLDQQDLFPSQQVGRSCSCAMRPRPR